MFFWAVCVPAWLQKYWLNKSLRTSKCLRVCRNLIDRATVSVFYLIKYCFFNHVTVIFENNVATALIVANFQAVCGTEFQNFKNAFVMFLFKIKFNS